MSPEGSHAQELYVPVELGCHPPDSWSTSNPEMVGSAPNLIVQVFITPSPALLLFLGVEVWG